MVFIFIRVCEDFLNGFVVAFVDRIPMGIFSMVLENLVRKVIKTLSFTNKVRQSQTSSVADRLRAVL